MQFINKNALIVFWRVIRYNLKIIFAGRFIWFLLASFAFYLFFAIMMVFQLLFVWKMMPETKGVALEKMDRTVGH